MKIKSILSIFFYIISYIYIVAQDFTKKFDLEFCNCLNEYGNYTDEVFDNCTNETIPKYQNEIEKKYSKTGEIKNYEAGQKVGEIFMKDFMIRLIGNCNTFYNHIDELKNEGLIGFKTDYKKKNLDSLNNNFKNTKEIIDYWEIANWYFANDDKNEAERIYLEILKNEPENPQALYFIALLYDDKKEYIKAKFYYDKLYEITKTIEYKMFSIMDEKKILK